MVTAARQALEAGDVDLVLPFVPAGAEQEVRGVFDQVLAVRVLGPKAQGTADRLFFETVVRLHRAGEGEAFTGLKPAGTPVGPVIPLAERAVEQGSAEQLTDFLATALHEQLTRRLDRIRDLALDRNRSVADARRYVEEMLDFEVYSHHLYEALRAGNHHNDAGHQH